MDGLKMKRAEPRQMGTKAQPLTELPNIPPNCLRSHSQLTRTYTGNDTYFLLVLVEFQNFQIVFRSVGEQLNSEYQDVDINRKFAILVEFGVWFLTL